MCFQKLKKCRRKRSTVLLLICIATIYYFLKNRLYPSVILLVELDKCPACYGTSACSDVFNKKIKLQPFNFYTTMSHIFSTKNVFFGEFNERKIVIKKLAQYEELDTFDRMICEESLDCCTDEKYPKQNYQTTDYFSRISNDISSDFINDDKSGLILCSNLTTRIFLNKLKHSLSRYLSVSNMWTLIRVNPEPILLQILQAEKGWPVPEYYGACGRIVIEEYAGLPLTAYFRSPWMLRAKIAAGLLDIAQMFTFHDSEFSYYLTDLSSDNIAINKDYKPIVVDLENVIITSKNISIEAVHEKFRIHNTEETGDCKNCFVFSPLDICSHSISDHNYYAICKHILSSESDTIPGGFLHHVPKDISSRYPDLKIMLAQCSVPSRNETRIEIAYKLKKMLKEIFNSYQR